MSKYCIKKLNLGKTVQRMKNVQKAILEKMNGRLAKYGKPGKKKPED